VSSGDSIMFEAFYNLSDNPFRLTPDPKFCFRHASHDQAHAYLQYALRLGEGFIMVTGRPGIGKTTLAEVFLGELELAEVVAARVAAANVETTDLMRVVAYSYGIDVEGVDKATILVRLKQFFVEETRSGKRVLLIIDEAQGLPYPALEELRLLADLQMDARPLVQLFLVGQEKLHELMQEPAMEQFQQRVIGVCHLEPLSLADTRAYMEHRLRKADWKGDPELTGEALLAIYQFSKGVPRHINKICTRLLLDGFMKKKHVLDQDNVREVADALRAERLAPMGSDQLAAAGAGKTELVPELENGTLTVADLALRADPQRPPLSAPLVTPEASARVEERKGTGHTKQTTAHPRQEPARVAQAGSRVVFGSGNGASPHQRRTRLSPAAARPKSGQRQHPERATIPAWKSARAPRSTTWKRRLGNAVIWVKAHATEWGGQLDVPAMVAWFRLYRNEVVRMFENQTVFRGRPGVWVGMMAALALAISVLLDSEEEGVNSHNVVLEEYPETAEVTVTTDEDMLLAARAEDYKGFEPASPEPSRYKPVEPRAEEHSNDSQLVNSDELSPHDDTVASPLAQGPVVAMSAFDAGINQPNGREELRGGEMSTEPDVAVTAQSSPEKPSATDSTPNITIAMSQGNEAPAGVLQPPVPPVEQEDTVESDQAVATDIPVQVAVVDASSVPEPVSREDRIIELLSQAQRALRSDRLLIPSGDNAYQYYQQVLELEPGNSVALFGMDQIVERYVSLGKNALARQDRVKARRYIARGSRVLPGDSRLIALQESVNAPEEPEIQVVAKPPVTETEPTETEPTEKKNLLSWIKAILGKSQTTGQKGDVPVEDYSN